METYYRVVFFILGTILGSFYNVVGYRLPRGESLIKPPSHCPNCNKRLTPLELIPILSFIIQGGKCRGCKTKISWFYPIFELLSGLLFLLAYIIFGMKIELFIALVFISTSLIIIISDYRYLIISDEVLITSIILLIVGIFIQRGLSGLLYAILDGIISFIIMYLLKKMGDFLFKKESMGGGDIKLMFIIGLILGYPMAILSIFFASLIGLPMSLLLTRKEDGNNVVPFGPFLVVGALIILLFKIDLSWIISLYGI